MHGSVCGLLSDEKYSIHGDSDNAYTSSNFRCLKVTTTAKNDVSCAFKEQSPMHWYKDSILSPIGVPGYF